jgi:UPF0716 family protein affecting phage T7 exclusion
LDEIGLAGMLVGVCAVVFAGAVIVGIVLGKRLDRAVEARAAGNVPETHEEDRAHE